MPNRRSDDVPGRKAAARGARVSPVPAALEGLSWGLSRSFLGLDEAAGAYDSAAAVILPVPYEATTSWGSGTRNGPRAILDASKYVELYDQELGREPADVGIHTLPPLELTREGPAAAMAELESGYEAVLDAAGDRFVTMLGGEHAISAPAIRATAKRQRDRVSVLQLDAHADLRGEFDGSPYSHACAMARVIDVADGSSPDLCVKAEEAPRLRLGCLGDLLFLEE